MSTSHDTTTHRPASKEGESGGCCGGHEPPVTERDESRAGAGQTLAPEQPGAKKEPEPRRASGGGCGCGH